jgi:hypothetical protein
MSSSSSYEMNDQIIMTFSDVMEQALSILTVEEGDSSLTPRPKRRRRYANRDREVTHLRLQHDYFDEDCVYPVILPSEVLYVENSFPKYYAQA